MLELKTGLLALTVVATGVAGLGAWGAHGFHGRGHRDHALMSRFVDFMIDQKLDEVNATDVQRAKVREVKERLMREGKALDGDRSAFHEELLGALSRDEVDPAALRALVKSRTDALVRFADEATDAAVELHGVFTPEQRARLLAELREHMAARHH